LRRARAAGPRPAAPARAHDPRRDQPARPVRLALQLVALDGPGIPHVCRARVAACLPQGAPLAEQIPALVEPDADRLQPPVLLVAQPAAALGSLEELVLLSDELLDPFVNCLVGHRQSPFGCRS